MNKETADENRMIANEWREFAKTTAFRRFMEYIDFQDYCAIQVAKGPILTFTDEDDAKIAFDPQKAASILQRSVGYDIIKTYVNGYVEFTTTN